MRIFLFIALLYCLPACRKDPDPKEPLALPPITTEGLNTFGCYINGELFVARTDNLVNQKIFVEYYNGTLELVGTTSLKLENPEILESIGLYVRSDWSNNMILTGNLPLDFSPPTDSAYAKHNNWSNVINYAFITDKIRKGNLCIIFHDSVNRILSGTFWFDAYDASNDTLVQVREGRFDVNY
jgi:hypothetical protein